MAQPVSPQFVLAPRLLDIDAAARFLGLSVAALRALHRAGHLPAPVRPPAARQRVSSRSTTTAQADRGREMRKLLFDVRDLDDLVSRWKEER